MILILILFINNTVTKSQKLKVFIEILSQSFFHLNPLFLLGIGMGLLIFKPFEIKFFFLKIFLFAIFIFYGLLFLGNYILIPLHLYYLFYFVYTLIFIIGVEIYSQITGFKEISLKSVLTIGWFFCVIGMGYFSSFHQYSNNQYNFFSFVLSICAIFIILQITLFFQQQYMYKMTSGQLSKEQYTLLILGIVFFIFRLIGKVLNLLEY